MQEGGQLFSHGCSAAAGSVSGDAWALLLLALQTVVTIAAAAAAGCYKAGGMLAIQPQWGYTHLSVHSSYSTHPSDHMSLLNVYGWLVQISGAYEQLCCAVLC